MADKKTETTELATAADTALAAAPDFSAFAEELDGLGGITFDTVKVPTGGITAFALPGDDPDNPDMVKEIVGVIVAKQPRNAYWANPYGQSEDVHPDCYSPDGKQGVDKVTGECIDCASCPRNKFKDDGSGKECKNTIDLYILRENEMLPIRLSVPPTSLTNLRDYLAKRVLAKGKKSAEVKTKFTLTKAVSNQNIPYAKIQFAKGDDLTPAEIAAVLPMIALVKETIARQAAEPDADYTEVQDDLPDEFK